jgi:hypothetical protein
MGFGAFSYGVGALSSVGRASRLHREGRRFEPVSAHHFPETENSTFINTRARPSRSDGVSVVTQARSGLNVDIGLGYQSILQALRAGCVNRRLGIGWISTER